MGTGTRAPKRDRHHTPERIEDRYTGGGGEVLLDDTGAERRRCWEFVLERTTPAAHEVEAGHVVLAVPNGSDVSVGSTTKGILGFAPSHVAQQILVAWRSASEPRVLGRVISVASGVTVDVCLVDS